MSHIGDPCIHCGAAHNVVPSGPCPKSEGLAAISRNIIYLQGLLTQHKEEAKKREQNLEDRLTRERHLLAMAQNSLDLKKIQLAESILQVSDYRKGGAEWESARHDAIQWFATGKAGYQGLKYEFFGTKNYDRWSGQRCDCKYGMGPRHGSICFRIGLTQEARKKDLSEAEKDAAIYYLLNLEKIQDARP